ncbi:MAG TPA: pyridoxamine 5'-phosphate oxidase family protein [Acidobacteriaceae bacterium]
MAKQFASMTPAHREFIARQQIFFTASATAASRVNVSPRPTDALRVLDERTVAYLDLTGSGSETAAHLRADGRITLMFCAFDEPPSILRLYGQGTSLIRHTSDYSALLASAFDNQEPPGARQIVRIDIDLVQTSCGYGVPLFDYVGERATLRRWAEHKGEAGLDEYRREKNASSIDGLPTGLAEEEICLPSEPLAAHRR